MKSLLISILDCIYPQYCAFCDDVLDSNHDRVFCRRCVSNIEFTPPESLCSRCGKVLHDYPVPANTLLCHDCRSRRIYFTKAVHIGPYAGVLKEVVQQFKYNRKTVLQQLTTDLIYSHICTYHPFAGVSFTYITYVPMYHADQCKRGYNQAELLARKLGEKMGIPVHKLLQKAKSTPRQAGLTRRERLENIRNCFTVTTPDLIRGASILVADDVFTTGTTLNECARILKKQGADTVCAVTLARGRSGTETL